MLQFHQKDRSGSENAIRRIGTVQRCYTVNMARQQSTPERGSDWIWILTIQKKSTLKQMPL
jgi:hypothetical protein